MLSLWVLGRATEFERAAVAADRSRRRWISAIAVGLAVAIATLALRPGRRRSSAPALLLEPVSASATSVSNVTRLGAGASTDAEARARPGPGTALGRYWLVDQIGAGGMAEVFTAVSFGVGKFRRPFVIKRLRAELDGNATAIGLFIDEANLASTLVHPNVVPVFDFGEVAGSYFLAEEYIVGRDLGRITSRLRDRGEPLLSTNAILHLANEILNGLAYAHDKRDDAGNPVGLVHRDITPENVIVSERGEVKILDFGIMKAKQRVSQTDSGTVRGNVGFMSPEQARGRAVDHRSDLFSTGLVILYAATGEPTYPGQTFYDLLTSAASGPGPMQQARIAAPRSSPAPSRTIPTSASSRAPSSAPRSPRTSRAAVSASWRTACSRCSATSCAPSRTASPPLTPASPALNRSPAPVSERSPDPSP
jgi:serine/threonine protein kinase